MAPSTTTNGRNKYIWCKKERYGSFPTSPPTAKMNTVFQFSFHSTVIKLIPKWIWCSTSFSLIYWRFLMKQGVAWVTIPVDWCWYSCWRFATSPFCGFWRVRRREWGRGWSVWRRWSERQNVNVHIAESGGVFAASKVLFWVLPASHQV